MSQQPTATHPPRYWWRAKYGVDWWACGILLFALVAASPILAVIYLALTPTDNIWPHLVSTVLGGYVATTLGLMVGVGLGTLIIGVGTAWLVTMCRFPGRRLFEWGMVLPLAMPSYIIAYVYTDLLEFSGPLQGAMRDIFGWSSKQDYWFPEVRSLGGAIAMMTLVLYPYVYLLSRAAFLEQSVGVFEASRTLGRGPWLSFISVALPLARPAIIIGLYLVLMETLNDYGTVDFFAVNTFSLGIFDVWMNMNNISGAAQLATVMLIFVGGLILAERHARRKRRFHNTSSKMQALPGFPLVGGRALLATMACLLPILLGFILPTIILVDYSHTFYDPALSREILNNAWNSVRLSVLAGAIAVAICIFMAYGERIRNSPLLAGANRIAAMGYAVPGAVLAVGVLVVLGGLDNSIDSAMRRHFGLSTGLIFSGTIAAVTFGYLVRFLALALGTVEASLSKITPNMDGASRSLGRGAFNTMRLVHLPLIRSGVLTAVLLVFVDCMKELPMTIILRPFNFQTLATFVHQYASDEQLGEAALAALSIVGVGVLPVILLSLTIAKSRPGQTSAQ